jgi:hypothetical protein
MANELQVIKESSILAQEDFDFLACVAEELRDTLSKRQIFRTETEMGVSVLNDVRFPTAASKYWQAVREQGVMFENLVSNSFEYRRNEVKIRRLQKKISELEDVFEIEEAKIDLDQCLFNRENLALVAKDRMREIRLWSGIKAKLDDGSFDTSDVNTHQLVSYTQRFVLEAFNAPANIQLDEANNLRGQLATSLKEAQQRGVLGDVVSGLPAEVVDRVLIQSGMLRVGGPSEMRHEQVSQ